LVIKLQGDVIEFGGSHEFFLTVVQRNNDEGEKDQHGSGDPFKHLAFLQILTHCK
jgi:hypothetical protein